MTTGLHDSQVQYWEPAKWVARLRATKTDDNLLLLKTNMSAGHGGASGRYDSYRETALVYAEAHPDETAAQHVMTCLIDFDDPGLRILPYNRVLDGLTNSLYEAIARWVREVFVVQALDAPASYGDRLEAMAAEAGAGGPAIVMAGPGDAAYLLTLQDPESLLRMVPSGINVPLHHVESWVLQEVVLRPLLGPRMERYLTYTHDSAAALAVANGEAQYAFLSKGVPTDLFERIVGDGVRMPRKSTYFWPKLPSGLVARRLTGAV